MATLNEKGEKYNFAAIAEDDFDHGLLNMETILRIKEIENYIDKDNSFDAEEINLVENCLLKLEAILYHIDNIKKIKEKNFDHIKRLFNNKDNDSATCAFMGKDLVFEFEALLLQAMASLEIITSLATHRLKGKETRKFRKFKKIVDNTNSGEYTEKLKGILKDCEWLYESEILIQADENRKSRRDYVAHYGSLMKTNDCLLTVSGVGKGKILIFDIEFRKSIPLMNTTSKILEYVPYLIINIISILCGLNKIDKKEFVNDIGRDFIILSEAMAKSGNYFKIGIIKDMNRINFIIGDIYISDESLSKAIQI